MTWMHCCAAAHKAVAAPGLKNEPGWLQGGDAAASSSMVPHLGAADAGSVACCVSAFVWGIMTLHAEPGKLGQLSTVVWS